MQAETLGRLHEEDENALHALARYARVSRCPVCDQEI